MHGNVTQSPRRGTGRAEVTITPYPYLVMNPGNATHLVGITLLWSNMSEALNSGKIPLLVLYGPARRLELFESKHQLLERLPAPTVKDDPDYFARWFTINSILDALPKVYVVVTPTPMEQLVTGQATLDLEGYPCAEDFNAIIALLKHSTGGSRDDAHES